MNLRANIARIGWLALLALAGSAWAAPELQSAVDPETLYVGDSFTWTLTVQGATKVDAPKIPELPDFFLRPNAPQILEQGKTRTFVFRYRVIPRRVGLLTLPPVSVLADGKELSTELRALNVGEAQSTPDMRLEVSLDRSEAYVGQPVVVTVTWSFALPIPDIKALDVRVPLFSDSDFSVLVPEDERALQDRRSRSIGLPVEGQRVTAAIGAVEINTQPFTTLTFQRILVPRKAGNFNFAPVRLLCSYLPGQSKSNGRRSQYPSYFDNDFFRQPDRQEDYVRYRARSEEVSLRVLPLPEAGRPTDFSGVVGSGELLVQAEPQILTIGDPVTLTVRLHGFSQPTALSLPPLTTLADFSGQFLVPKEQASPRVQDGDAVFIQSVQPLRTAITEVPSLAVTIFNPEERKYQTLRSKAIPLQIRPDGAITAIDLGGDAPSSQQENPAGIWSNLPANAVDSLTLAGWFVRRVAFAWLLLPPLFLWAFIPVARRYRLKRSDPLRWRQITASGRLRHALKHSSDSEAQRVAVSAYLAVRLGIREGALSYREIARALDQRGIKPADTTMAVLRELFHQADLARFGGQQAVASADSARLRNALDALERKFDR